MRSVLAAGLVAGLVVMLMNGPAFVLNAVSHHRFFLFMSQLGGGFAVGLLCGVMHDLPGGLNEGSNPQELVKSWGKNRVAGLMSGLGAAVIAAVIVAVKVGLSVGLSVGLMVELGLGFVAGLAVVLGFGLMPRLAGGFVAGLAVGSANGAGSPQGPVECWRNDRAFGLVIGLGLGFGFGFGFGTRSWSASSWGSWPGS